MSLQIRLFLVNRYTASFRTLQNKRSWNVFIISVTSWENYFLEIFQVFVNRFYLNCQVDCSLYQTLLNMLETFEAGKLSSSVSLLQHFAQCKTRRWNILVMSWKHKINIERNISDHLWLKCQISTLFQVVLSMQTQYVLMPSIVVFCAFWIDCLLFHEEPVLELWSFL